MEDSSACKLHHYSRDPDIEKRLEARARQIDIGKKSQAYVCYAQTVPKAARGRFDPLTPDPKDRLSKKQFDNAVRQWKSRLHEWFAQHQAQPGRSVAADGTVTEVLLVARAHAAAIIGDGGAVIEELKRVSRAHIALETQNNDPRKVTITGSAEAVAMAVSMVNERAEREAARGRADEQPR